MFNEDEITKEDYLKSLDTEDFLNNKETKEILDIEEYTYFDQYVKPKLIRLFENYAKTYNDKYFLYNDLNGTKNSDIFSEIIYNEISRKYNLNLFYENPELAKSLFK